MTAEELLAEVAGRCAARGIWWADFGHPTPGRKAAGQRRGFPRLFLAAPAAVMFRELKTDDGAWRGISSQHTSWKYRLTSGGQNWGIWSPADLISGRVDAELDQLAENHRQH